MGLLAIALLNSRNRWTDAEIERLTESRARYDNLHPAGTLIEGMLQMLMAWKGSWPICPVCHQPLAVETVRHFGVGLVCWEHKEVSTASITVPDKYAGIHVTASEIPVSLGGTLVSREDHAAKAKTVVRKGKGR